MLLSSCVGQSSLSADPSRSFPGAQVASFPNFSASFLWLDNNPPCRCRASCLRFNLSVKILLFPSLGFPNRRCTACWGAHVFLNDGFLEM